MKPAKTLGIAVGAFSLLLPVALGLALQPERDNPQEKYAIRVATGVVLLSVTVTDRKGLAIAGLEKENFKVYEDGIEQDVAFFSAERVPVSWGLILDRSGSMREMIRDVYSAAVHVIDEGTAEDEMFIATFSDRPQLASNFSSDRRHLEESVSRLQAGGSTALWDAVAFGLDQLKSARQRKKVLVVVTDGEDNHSRLGFTEIVDMVHESDVLIYTAGMGLAGRELKKLAEATGGKGHAPRNLRQCREVMKHISNEVSRHYSVAYYPKNVSRDGKWRIVRVTVAAGTGGTSYVVRTRPGYYGPKDEASR